MGERWWQFYTSRWEWSIHRARKIRREKGLNLEKERREEVSLVAGRYPGGGGQEAIKAGWELSLEVWVGHKDQEVFYAVATADAMLRWPCLTTKRWSKVQATVTSSWNMEFSQKISKYDDASYEKCCFSVCFPIFTPERLLLQFCDSKKAKCLHYGGSFWKDSSESF